MRQPSPDQAPKASGMPGGQHLRRPGYRDCSLRLSALVELLEACGQRPRQGKSQGDGGRAPWIREHFSWAKHSEDRRTTVRAALT